MGQMTPRDIEMTVRWIDNWDHACGMCGIDSDDIIQVIPPPPANGELAECAVIIMADKEVTRDQLIEACNVIGYMDKIRRIRECIPSNCSVDKLGYDDQRELARILSMEWEILCGMVEIKGERVRAIAPGGEGPTLNACKRAFLTEAVRRKVPMSVFRKAISKNARYNLFGQ